MGILRIKDIRPAQVVGDEAAQGSAHADPGGKGGGEQAQGQTPLALAVSDGDDFGGQPQHQGAPQPLQGPGRHQPGQAGGQAAEGRGAGEDEQS